jgi:16S rRNA processing protein RimM
MRQRLENPVRLGIIVGVRGIKGEVRIKSFTDDPVDIGAYGPLYDRTGDRRFDLKVTGTQKGVVLARVDGVNDRTSAEALKKTELFIERDQLPAP